MSANHSNEALAPIHLHNSNPESTLLPLLHLHLPYSVPVYRRIQFPSHGQYAHILATVSPSTAAQSDSTQKQDVNACLAAAYVDRSRRPETDAWIFLAWDNPAHAPAAGTCICATLLVSLLRHTAKNIPFPPLSPEDEADALAAVAADSTGDAAKKFHGHSADAKAYLTDLHNASILKVGALHARSAPVLDARGWLRRDKPGLDFVYRKYYFPASMATSDAPEGLRWGIVNRDADISLVRSRTAIPRKHRTLKTLPSAGLYLVADGADALPVAWAFLGLDGSLISLHVEPVYRGRGLAKAVGRKLFREGFAVFGDALGGLAHADVLVENKESNGVCLSLGGVDGWMEYWVRVDLDKVREAFEA